MTDRQPDSAARVAHWTMHWLQQASDSQLCQRAFALGRDAEALLRAVRHSDSEPFAYLRTLLAAAPAPATIPDNIVLRCDDAYPDLLRHAAGAPFGLYLHGARELLAAAPKVAIVGSRRPRPGSRESARHIATGLARAGVVVVSGLAIGVDGIAHRATLAAGGATIAVLGSGTGNVHPASHRALASDIVEAGGLLVSEYAPPIGARPWRFPARNRIIAALSDYVVVVQARRESGSMGTVMHAAELGVGVGAVPGAIGDQAFEGSLDVLRDGARAIIDATSVLRELGIEADTSAPTHQFGGLLDAPRSADELAACFDMPVADVLVELVDLELDGLVRRTPEGTYVNAVPS